MRIMGRALILGGSFLCLLLSHGAAQAQQVPPLTYLFVEVKDTAGKAVDDATVTFGGPPHQFKTNKDGVAEASVRLWQSATSYELQVSKPGYLTAEDVVFLSGGRKMMPEFPFAAGVSAEGLGGARPPPLRVTLSREPATPAGRRQAEEEGRRRRLLLAVKRGDAAQVRAALEAGVGPETADAGGVPAIAWAAFAGGAETITTLLAAGANVRNKSSPGRLALLLYLASGLDRASRDAGSRSVGQNVEVVRRLVEAGADVNARDPRWGTVLNAAVARTPYADQPPYVLTADTVRLLMATGADVNAADAEGKTPLMTAASLNSVSVVRMLLGAGAAVNAKDRRGQTALAYAGGYKAEGKGLDAARLLVSAGADVNAADAEGKTPLMLAARNHSPEAVGLLLEAGASVKARDKLGRTALHYVKSELYGDASPALVRVLRAAGADVNAADAEGRTPLMTASEGFHRMMLDALLEAGAGASVNAKDAEGRTALMLAAGAGYLDRVRTLLGAGADLRARDKHGRTALSHSALGRSRPEVVRFLVGAGLDVNAPDAEGQTPLMLAARGRSAEVVAALLESGASVNDRDAQGRTPLLHAMPEQRYDPVSAVVRALMEAGAKVEEADAAGQTPLMLAARAGSEEAVRLMLDWGAKVNARDGRGRTPLILAAHDRSHTAAVILLLAAGADVDAADEDGRTALMEAAAGRNPRGAAGSSDAETVVRLLAAGADPRRADRAGRTALSVARETGYTAAVNLLEEAARRR